MQVRIISHREPEPLNLEAFIRLARFALEREAAPPQAEVSIAIVDNEEMAQLNKTYRDQEGPTDVLSFPCDSPHMIPAEDEPVALGDIIIAPAVAEKSAIELGHTIEHELNTLLVHGILHLMGYAHTQDDDARIMEARQHVIVAAWAIHV